MRYLLILILCTTSFAQQVDISSLPEAERARIQQLVNQQPVTPQKVLEWAEIGKSVGVAVGSTAKELGIAINDFANSPVGKIALVLIVWKLMGGSILGMLFGVLLALGSLRWIFRIYDQRFKYTFIEKPFLYGLFTIKVVENRSLIENYRLMDSDVFMFIAATVSFIIGLITTLVTIANI